jgi:hypothetical protein
MLMNNRFVVPAMAADNITKFSSLQAALAAPGLNAGDVIQIEPNSSPGQLAKGDIPALKNLTIQGDPMFDVESIPFFVANGVTIGPAQRGFTLKNVQVDVQIEHLQFTADATICGCRIKNDFAGTCLLFVGTSAAAVSNSYIENANPQAQGETLLYVQPANGSHNRITDNTFTLLAGTEITLVNYFGGTGTTDLVAHNTFMGNTDDAALLSIDDTQGLTVQGNTFTDSYAIAANAITASSVQNLQILDNVISLPDGGEGIYASATTTASSSLMIANNHINTGSQGIGIDFAVGMPGSSFVATVQNNDLQGNSTAVLIEKGQGGSVAGIDLGLGPQNGLGANDFRGDATAIDVSALAAAGPIGAFLNIFGVSDPTTVIHDQHNDPTLAAVVSSNPLTGNSAYVETLYLAFLHRTGDLSNPKDAGGWAAHLGQGMPAATVANAIARSPEALGVAVDGLYHRFLGRDADAAGRANFVAYLQNGGTLEGVSQMMLASSEYQSRFPTGSSFVKSLYQNLLHRTGSTAEINSWVAQLPQLGRAGAAQAFLFSQEYRADEVNDDYTNLLHRTPSTTEVTNWVNSGKDILTIDILFAGSPEFQVNG